MSDFDFHETTTRTARKEHVCTDCGWDIEPGDTYHDTRTVYEGRWQKHKTCDPCMELYKIAWKKNPDGIELCEWVWGFHDKGQIISDQALLSFAIRNSAAILRASYDKAEEDNNGYRRAWISARRTGESLLDLIKEVQR